MKRSKIIFCLLPLLIFTCTSCGTNNEHIKCERVNLKVNEKFNVSSFKDVSFIYEFKLTDSNGFTFIDVPMDNLYLADINNDGYLDFCASLSIGSGQINNALLIYDYKNQNTLYHLSDRRNYDYLFSSDENNYLKATKYEIKYPHEFLDEGYIRYINNEVMIEWTKDNK